MNGRQNGTVAGSEPNGIGLQNGANGQKVENKVAGEGTWQGHRESVLNRGEEGSKMKRRGEREKWRWCAFEPRSLAFWTVVSQVRSRSEPPQMGFSFLVCLTSNLAKVV
jgi:hypothetical protein